MEPKGGQVQHLPFPVTNGCAFKKNNFTEPRLAEGTSSRDTDTTEPLVTFKPQGSRLQREDVVDPEELSQGVTRVRISEFEQSASPIISSPEARHSLRTWGLKRFTALVTAFECDSERKGL